MAARATGWRTSSGPPQQLHNFGSAGSRRAAKSYARSRRDARVADAHEGSVAQLAAGVVARDVQPLNDGRARQRRPKCVAKGSRQVTNG